MITTQNLQVAINIIVKVCRKLTFRGTFLTSLMYKIIATEKFL